MSQYVDIKWLQMADKVQYCHDEWEMAKYFLWKDKERDSPS